MSFKIKLFMRIRHDQNCNKTISSFCFAGQAKIFGSNRTIRLGAQLTFHEPQRNKPCRAWLLLMNAEHLILLSQPSRRHASCLCLLGLLRETKKQKIKGDSIKNLNNKQTFNGPILLKIHIIVVVC